MRHDGAECLIIKIYVIVMKLFSTIFGYMKKYNVAVMIVNFLATS